MTCDALTGASVSVGCGTLESKARNKNYERTCCLGCQGKNGKNGEAGISKCDFKCHTAVLTSQKTAVINLVSRELNS